MFYKLDPTKPRHRQLKRLILAEKDMGEAANAIRAALPLKPDDKTRYHITAAAIIYYARPFVSGRSWTRISSKWEECFPTPELRDLHHFILMWRDAAVAHSDDEMHKVEFLPRGTKIKFAKEGGSEIEFILSSPSNYLSTPQFPPEHYDAFLDLLKFQRERLAKAASLEKDALAAELIKPNDSTKR